MLFRDSEEILIGLLTAVLRPPHPIRRAEVQNSDIEKSRVDERGIVLDIHVLLDNGRRIDVEMQTRWHKGIEKRFVYYLARTYALQQEEGDDFNKLVPCAGIYFLDFDLTRSERFHNKFALLERDSGLLFSDALQFHTIELRKLNAEQTQHLAQSHDADEALARWSRFLKSTDPAELKEIAMADPVIAKAEERLRELSADEKARRYALDRERDMRAWKARVAEETEDAHAKGREDKQRETLTLILETRFGEVPPAFRKRLSNASEQELDGWVRAALSANSLDDVFA